MGANLFKLVPLVLLGGIATYTIAQTTRPAVPNVEPATVKNGVRSIVLPSIAPPELPDGPNKDIYTANCIICHTQRYLTMQPRFPRKTWQAEVEKMKKTYGAPIQDQQIPQIVDYLMSVRGK